MPDALCEKPSPKLYERYAVFGACVIYVAVIAAAVSHHEPWSDEAQSWLLARDSHPLELWTKLLHREGTPGLWPSLLQVLIRCGLPYKALNVVSGAAGFAAVYLLLTKAPFPLALRLVLPFTYFLCYQYAVLARSYSLLPLLMLGCAVLFRRALQRPGLLILPLCLLAAVSAQGFVVSVAFWLAFHWQLRERWSRFAAADKKWMAASIAFYLLVLVAVGALAWPTRDVTFGQAPHFLLRDALSNASEQLQESFGNGVAGVLAIALTIPFLWRTAGLPFLVLSMTALLLLGALVYSSAWHSGVLFLTWIVAIWIGTENARPSWLVTVCLLSMCAVHCYWTAKSVVYDWSFPYSGSAAAAAYLQSSGAVKQPLFGLGFASVGVQPYFAKNIFNNFGSPDTPAFWSWAKSNHVNEAAERLGSSRPAYILVSYMSPPERRLWRDLVLCSGYKLSKHFEGNIFWRTKTLQPDAYDFYESGPVPCDCSLSSTISLAEQPQSAQLLWGFYDEGKPWSWTARKFSVVLERPPHASEAGTRLKLSFYLPDSQIAKLGPMTLSASVGRIRLQSRKFSKGGVYDYLVSVPVSALYSRMVSVDFKFDKAAAPSTRDARELAAVVMAVGLVSP